MAAGRWKHWMSIIDGNLVYWMGGVRNKIAVREWIKYDL